MRKQLFVACAFSFLLLTFSTPHVEKKSSLRIRYTLNYPGDSWDNNRIGLLWALSSLGATLPKGSIDSSITWESKHVFSLDFRRLGFTAHAQRALETLSDSLRQTTAYKKNNAIDLGHFITLTIGCSWHYYAITGVPRTYGEMLNKIKGRANSAYAILKSSVSHHERRIRVSTDSGIQNTVFIAEEGEGSLRDETFVVKEYEVIDIFPNGQLRFAIYNADGELAAGGSTALSASGKPAKCLWCHEINIQPLYLPTDSVAGFLTPGQFSREVRRLRALLAEYRTTLLSDVDFGRLQDHTYLELLYISFMEPSLKKLSQEWGLPEKALRRILKEKEIHRHSEFGFLGALYFRPDILDKGPAPGQLPLSIRETSSTEPNYLPPTE